MYVACWRHITIPITSNYQPILKIIENFVTCLCSACYIASKRCEFIWQLGSSADNFGFKIPMLVLKTRQRVQRRSAKKNVWKNWCKTPGNCVVANGESKDELPIHPFLAAPCPAFDSINQCLTANWWNCTSVHEIPRIQTEYVLKMSETFWLFLTRSRHMSA